MKILFLAPYPLKSSPSQRFRFEQYFGVLTAAGHTYSFQSFLTPTGWRNIYSKGKHLQKVWAIVLGFVRRIVILPAALTADIVFIHREVGPIGPPVFEWIIAKVLRKKIVYDFDDAIWHTDRESEGWLAGIFRWRTKVGAICRWSHAVSCGNDFLCDYARRYNANVRYNPTTIDTTYHRLTEHSRSNEIVIGWTGSHSTLKYLDTIVPVIQELGKKYSNLVFMVIANRKPDLPVSSLRFVPWRDESEIEDLAKFDIGIMPMPGDEWSKGKCGFKILQYMSLQIPAVASPVGVNNKIIQDGINGFLCNTSQDWLTKLTRLIDDQSLRKKIGEPGRQTVEKYYSVSSNTSSFLLLFELSASNTRASK